jgi:hypothetical protein
VRTRDDLGEAESLVTRLLGLAVDQVDEDRLRLIERGLVARVSHVDAEAVQDSCTLFADRDLVHLQAVRCLCRRTERQSRKQDGHGR